MDYSQGNYEAYARPRKPAGVDEKSAYLVGGGLASLAAAAFLIRGGREMEAYFECLWDLYRSIPSLEIENASVLDEFLLAQQG